MNHLSLAQRQSPMWRDLMAHWADRIEKLRTQLEGSRSELDTAILRGRIAELRVVMALDKEVPTALE